METNDLIKHLAMQAGSVRSLRPPWQRAAVWLAVSLPTIAMFTLFMSLRDDLAAKLGDPRFLIEEAATLSTAAVAAIAAFCSVVPGRSRKLALFPIVPLTIWLGSLGQGCFERWLLDGNVAWRLSLDWLCLPAIATAGAVPAFIMIAMLRRGAPLTPRMTMMLGALAAAGVGNFGLRLFHPQDACIVVLVWQFGSVALLTLVAGLGGRSVLRWPRLDHARA